jgi:nanoRNase/pAp phosphatase (c-di-AMP/oligoRNAs hydrolase)
MGKQVNCYTTHTPSQMYHWVSDIDQVRTAVDYTKRYDGLIFVDFTEYNRIPSLTTGHEDWFDSHHKIIIDHHEVIATTPLTTAYIVPDMTSTCEMIYEIWHSIDVSVITPSVATHLYL